MKVTLDKDDIIQALHQYIKELGLPNGEVVENQIYDTFTVDVEITLDGKKPKKSKAVKESVVETQAAEETQPEEPKEEEVKPLFFMS